MMSSSNYAKATAGSFILLMRRSIWIFICGKKKISIWIDKTLPYFENSRFVVRMRLLRS